MRPADQVDDVWFTGWHGVTDQAGAVTLVCLPHAGAGASVYARWAPLLPPWVRLVGVTLPGRESRISEPLLTSVDEVVEHLGPAVSARVQEPFVLFGHSLGALIGYELACWLGTHNGAVRPEILVVSGRTAPHHASRPTEIHALDDEAFLIAMHERYGGIPEALLDNPELRDIFLPSLRGDMSILARYYQSGHILPAGTELLVLGAQDDPTTTTDGLHAWSELTSGSTTIKVFPDGGHFYAQTRALQVTEAVVNAIVARTTPW
ncbi:thioesterase [Actinomyces sp. 2119]|uniref:thioesterase II family protein n=1 Tax=Actinomyces sp. 2119 TaxID=2321393 RepID=UPI000E6C4A78|nr:alpha/beta fold hydrolase [Actinomyces sp. 2119]RJF41177.1 thioesterase [Actinomyces sp. 2119]